MRALLFVTMLTGGIVDAMEAVEKAVAKALDMQQPGDYCTLFTLWEFLCVIWAPSCDSLGGDICWHQLHFLLELVASHCMHVSQ